MNSFVQRFSNKIKGIITGFDRIVFKGCLRPDLDYRAQRRSRRLSGRASHPGSAGREMIRAAHFAPRFFIGVRKNPTKSGAPRLAGQGCGCAARNAILVYAWGREIRRCAGIAGDFSNEMHRAYTSFPHHPYPALFSRFSSLSL